MHTAVLPMQYAMRFTCHLFLLLLMILHCDCLLFLGLRRQRGWPGRTLSFISLAGGLKGFNEPTQYRSIDVKASRTKPLERDALLVAECRPAATVGVRHKAVPQSSRMRLSVSMEAKHTLPLIRLSMTAYLGHSTMGP